MELWTIQLANYRLAKQLDIPLIDTTVKSGESTFAPSWDIVTGVKSGKIIEEQYTQEYTQLMRSSFVRNPSRWIEVCLMPKVAVSCYCSPGKFCHRHLLAEMFEKICTIRGIPFELKGELLKSSS